MLARIVKAFDISNAELQELWLILAKNQSEDKRASDFGQWLRDTVFIEYAAAA